MKLRRFLLALLMMVLLLPASSQVMEMPKSFLNFGLSGNLFYIYPEAAYMFNPVYILEIKKKTFFNDFYLNLANNNSETVNTIDYIGLGAVGGTQKINTNQIQLIPQVTAFLPGEKNTLGFTLNLDYDNDSTRTVLTNYTLNPQVVTEDDVEWDFNGTVAGYYAVPLDSLRIGARIGFKYNLDPVGLTTETDVSQNNGATYVTGSSGDTQNEQNLIPSLTLGLLTELAGGELGVSLAVSYDHYDNVVYTQIDRDGDGFDDEFVPLEEQQQSSETWGAGNSDYTRKNVSDDFQSTIYFSYIRPLASGNNFILGGSIVPFSQGMQESYVHATATDSSSDQLKKNTMSAMVLGGMELKPGEDFRLRFGVGANYSMFNQVPETLDAAGNSTFNAANIYHYDEVAWANEPNDNQVISNANSTTSAYARNTLTLNGVLGLEWMPLDNLVIFNAINMDYLLRWTKYSVFNTTDDTVWDETAFLNSGTLNLECAMGVGVFLKKDLYLGFKAATTNLYVNLSGDDDTLPFRDGEDSTGGQGGYNNLYDSGSGNFTLDIYAILSL